MRKLISTGAIAALAALPLIVGAGSASASCKGRANTGTAVGAVGGALVGNSISRGGGGALLGGLGGAVLGHSIAKSGCGHYSNRHAYYRRHDRRHHDSRVAYYDSYGRPVYR